MKALTQYGRMVEKHWREFRPQMAAELEARGLLHVILPESEQKTEADLDQIHRQ